MRKNRYEYKFNGLSKEILENDYKELKSLNKIGKKYNVHCDTIIRWFKSLNIEYDNRKRSKNEHIFIEDNEISMYLAGFIAADGSITKNGKNAFQLTISLSNKDYEFLNKIHNFFEHDGKIFEINNHESYLNNRKIISSIKGFRICSTKLCKDLMERFNVKPNKSLTYQFPERLENHPLIHHFIRGYFDGDGTFAIRNPNKINKQSKINITFGMLGTEQFLNKIQNILSNNIGLDKNKLYKIGNIHNIMYCGNRQAALIGDWLYKDATIYLDRKYQRYLLAKSILDKNK